MQSTRTLKSAWLVTWETVGGHTKIAKRKQIVSILNYRRSPQNVRLFVEQLYMALGKSSWDKLSTADRPKENAYPARFMQRSGLPWRGQIHCGDDPFLFARLVGDLRVVCHDTGREEVLWTERPIPDLSRS